MSGAALLPGKEGPAGDHQAPTHAASRAPSPPPASPTSKAVQPLFTSLSSQSTDFSFFEKQPSQPTDSAITFRPTPQEEEKLTAPPRPISQPSAKTTAARNTRAGTIAVILALLLTAVSVHCCDISRRFASHQHHEHLQGSISPITPATMDTTPAEAHDHQGPNQHVNWEDFLDHRPTKEATLHPRLINTLPAEYIPGYRNISQEDYSATATDTMTSSGKQHQRPSRWPRIIVIGDVHGELEVLQNLLRKVGYTPRAEGGQDHVILAGDIINKGPDTPGVLDLAIREGFSGVRGNHDDKLLKLFDEYEGVDDGELVVVEDEVEGQYTPAENGEAMSEENASDNNDDDEEEASPITDSMDNLELRDSEPNADEVSGKKHKKNKHKDKKDKKHGKKKKHGEKGKHHIPRKDRRGLAIIRSCTPEQRQWLANLPLILRVGHIPYWPSSSLSSESTTSKPSLKKPSPYGGEVVVVHGGLVPGIPLEQQDPWAVLHMRTLLINGEKKGKGRHGKKGKKDKKHKKKGKKHKKAKDTEVSSSTSDDDSQGSSSNDDGDDNDNNLNIKGTHKVPPPFSNMTPLETREGTPWARIWDKYQQKHIQHQDERTTVIFGHDAKAGLQLGEYTFGLDTGCVAGGKLTAMVFSEDEKHRDSGEGPVKVTHQIFSVKCRDGTPNLL